MLITQGQFIWALSLFQNPNPSSSRKWLILPLQGIQGPLPRGKLSRDLGLGQDLGRGLGLDKGQDPVLEVMAGQDHQFMEGQGHPFMEGPSLQILVTHFM